MNKGIFPEPNVLRDIVQDLDVQEFSGDWKTPISGLITDSRRVVPGSVFFAIPGLRTNGELFVEEAISRGAAAIVTTVPPSRHTQVAWIRVGDVRKALAAAARNFYNHPERKLQVAGVTGTNGKTTVTTLLHYLLQHGGERWGLIGTVRYELGERSLPSHKTTPEAPDIYSMMTHMVAARCPGLAMEVSSHAIAQYRVDGMAFKVLAFTNLSRDHIDYHASMEEYFEVKTRPFLGLCGPLPEVAVLNVDDPAGRRLSALLPAQVRQITFGESPEAHLRATGAQLHPGGSTFNLVRDGSAAGTVHTTLPGRYNVSNILCALAIASALGRDTGALLPAISAFPGVPGRMERVATELPCQIFVDYAHTDDALKNALGMLRPITPGRLLVVFGCGGNRDRGKRPAMTAVVQSLADCAWATADNPRKELQQTIFEDMRGGVTKPESITFVEDRRHAISLALDAMRTGDTLLIAGKGHEAYQEFADVTVPFDDRQVTRELLALKQYRVAARPPA
ncbi:MAG: UDP-N-acetylmuramoyl-L-alanyl-D-glutamate--2,6-diaminopimelate ligase [Puniceicoccales bacterium]|jgi:UDP-N-acetylmuramoyl-L-alanyl-D-glutamate--2,6-diaminopimelate ligase|nr:UDP-N-acetylmuramoyl-L-alanyl-D-glutamate--2,6-diaminopimelate ligase [Puniceicoccales bacterium]